MTPPGFDPELDGTAAPYWSMTVREYLDGRWEVDYPDGTTETYVGADEAAEGYAAWLRQHPDPSQDDGPPLTT